VNVGANDPREGWLHACDRYDRLSASNPFFAPLASVLRELSGGTCAHVAVARLVGVDLHLSRADAAGAAVPGDASAAPVDVRLRALTDDAIEIRCTEGAPRTRSRVRIVAAEQAASAVEECLWEIGWISEAEWGAER
jgi:hypothetical protein